MRSTVTLFRVRGVPVSVSWSWLVILVLVVWSLAAGLFPSSYPGHSELAYVAMAAVAAFLFFASVLLHELSHTLAALHEGVRVGEITLWLFGGVSRAEDELPSPKVEMRVVAAGPLTTLALTLVSWAVAAAAAGLGLPETVYGVPVYLAVVNALLLVFNVVPALPLDGGRLLHAFLWHRNGDRHAATLVAAAAGRVFAVLLVTWGFAGLLLSPHADLSGIWLVVIGWFLAAAAQQEAVGARTERALAGLRVCDLMTVPQTLRTDETLAEFGDALDETGPHRAYPVADEGRLVGLMLTRTAGAVPIESRALVRVGEVMLPRDEVPTAGSEDRVVACLPTLRRPPGRVVVVEGDRVVGVLAAEDVDRRITVPTAGGRRLGGARLPRFFPR